MTVSASTTSVATVAMVVKLCGSTTHEATRTSTRSKFCACNVGKVLPNALRMSAEERTQASEAAAARRW